MKINKIEIIGEIINFSKKIEDKRGNEYYFIKLIQSRILEKKSKNSTFFYIKVTDDLIKKYKDIIVVGQTVYINGYLNSSFKDGLLINYIYPIDIKNYSNYKKSEIITYDTDGVMLWHGKRCIKVDCPSENKEELEMLIKEISDDK